MTNRPDEAEVIGLGQACVDFLCLTPLYPAENQKVELIGMEKQCGGPASTALVTLSRLGIKTSFLGSVSDDSFGKDIIADLGKENVDTTYLKVTPGFASQFAFISVTKGTGDRTIFWCPSTSPFLAPHDIDLSRFSNAKILHLDGLMLEAGIEAARQARKQGLRVVLDAGTMREKTKDLLSLIDTLITSENFAIPVAGVESSPEDRLRVLREYCPGDIIITLGAKGSIGLSGKTLIHQEPFPVNTIDSTGAGDVYHGAYIYGMLNNWSMEKSMGFASAAAALKCRKLGGRKGIPSLFQVMQSIESGNKNSCQKL